MLPRHILPNIWKMIDSPDIILLNGARQTGKTTLLKMIREKLIAEKNAGPQQIHWFDLERVEDLSIWSSQETALAALPLDEKKRQFLFIDEFQKSKSIGSILKVLHDHYPIFKIFITGSASWYLTTNESLTGRKRIFPVWPLNFEEYLIWKNDQKTSLYYQLALKNIHHAAASMISRVNRAWLDFATFGGYPRAVISKTKTEKIQVLSEILNSYLLRDIQIWSYAANSLEVKKILTLLASQAGSLLDANSLGLNVGMGRTALINRLELLQNTFILHLSRPYFTNKTKELTKNPKTYLIDSGLRNMLLENFSLLPQTSEFGHAMENLIAAEILKRNKPLDTLLYWRKKTGQEVDMILKRENKLIPIEVKSGKITSLPESMKSFIESYRSKQAYILNWSEIKEEKYKTCRILFRPLWYPVGF